MKAIAAGFAFLLLAVPAQAQTDDARWEPWIGCWELATENIGEGAPAAGRLSGSGVTQRPSGAFPRVCVTRAGNGVRVETTVRAQAALDQTIVADATDRPLTDADCSGTQRAEWSRDGLRFFSNATLACKDDPAPRRVSGISMMASNGTWLDIQTIAVGSRETVRVRRYYRATDQPAISRPVTAAASLSLDDVREASGKVAARALETALVETNTGFDLTGRSLVELDDAGVPDSVIDLLVALSYPDRFVVERSSSSSSGGTIFSNDPFMVGWAFGYPAFYDDYFYSPYYYSPFGYSRRSFGGFGLSGDGIGVAGVPPGPQPSGAGRVVDGQGYTRVRPRETTSAADNPSTVSRTSRSTASADAPAASTPPSSSGGSTESGSSTSSGGGNSSGSSSSDTGRTAQPR